MSDDMTAQRWLDRTQAITDRATEGPWEDRRGVLDDVEVFHSNEHVSWVASTGDAAEHKAAEDAAFIAHARTALPQAVAALRATLDMHAKIVTDQHIDGPTAVCEQCSEDRMFAIWPCPTVAAITEALGEE